MNSIKKKIEWNKYIVALSPIFLIFYISNETYAIDYRAFYLAGKSVLNNLNPYLNHISLSSDYYGPINSELSKFSGWKYPPLASYIFTNDKHRIDFFSENLNFGEVQVNGIKYAIYLPHGGIKESGIGHDCSHLALYDYLTKKRISVAL